MRSPDLLQEASKVLDGSTPVRLARHLATLRPTGDTTGKPPLDVAEVRADSVSQPEGVRLFVVTYEGAEGHNPVASFALREGESRKATMSVMVGDRIPSLGAIGVAAGALLDANRFTTGQIPAGASNLDPVTLSGATPNFSMNPQTKTIVVTPLAA